MPRQGRVGGYAVGSCRAVLAAALNVSKGGVGIYIYSSERAKPMGMKNPTSPSIDSRNCKEERAYLVNHLNGRPQMHQERREVGARRRVVGAGRRVVDAKRISYLLFHVTISFSTFVDLIIYATS
ncbi:unnamed protein product [Prunus brigantina]